ncbi:MAG: hypothetical protein NVSMB62_25620 [Acidobacteriaceae bacterium]
MRHLSRLTRHAVPLCLWLIITPCLLGQNADVSVTFSVQPSPRSEGVKRQHLANASDVVVWLTPAASNPISRRNAQSKEHYRLVQNNKQFTPHLLVVPVGTNVEFPNRDPFFHNVFSLFNGKRFDLGLYESGTTRTVRFDREGVSYIFCNIHPEMGAVVLALSTPYYAVSGPDGSAVIRGVSPGEYRLSVWSETAEPIENPIAERVVRVSAESLHLGQIALKSGGDPMSHHKNKFGEDYLPGHTAPY